MVGVVKLVPVPRGEPPVDAAYHFKVPGPAAPSVTVPTPQREAGVVEVTTGLFTVIITDAEYPGAPALQVAFRRT